MADACTRGGRTTRSRRGDAGGGEQEQQKQKRSYVTRTLRGRKETSCQAAEVVDLCSSSSDEGNGEDEKRGEKVVVDEEKTDKADLEEEEEDIWGRGCRTIIDFESDDSLSNLTVKTFLR